MSDYGRMNDPNRQWSVYVIREEGSDNVCKIGTASNVAYRLSGLRNGNHRPLHVAKQFTVTGRAEALRIERAAQLALGAWRITGRDWFLCSPPETAIECIAKELAR